MYSDVLVPFFRVHMEPLQPFDFVDPGSRVPDPNNNPLSELLDHPDVIIEDLTPAAGSIISGIQLSQLTDVQKDQLAVFVARRKVVAFKNQDWADEKDLDKVRDYGKHFGRLHVHVSY
jgi:sulfonate dioxygenase